MVEKSDLRRVPAFADLPDDQLDWFLGNSQELRVAVGDTYIRQGDPADWMCVILEGQFQWRGDLGGDTVTCAARAGDVTGILPFSRMKRYSVTFRALTEGRLLKFPASLFPELVQKMPELTARLVGYLSDRVRETTRVEQQRDRLASLGKLSAGLAHELNNPASAAKRATSQLRDVLKKIRDASHELGSRDLTLAQKAEIEKLESLFATLDADTARAALVRIAASVEVATLLNEIESGTSRISDLVRAIKEYTYMDQTPLQNVDIVKSLKTTFHF